MVANCLKKQFYLLNVFLTVNVIAGLICEIKGLFLCEVSMCFVR